MELARQQAASGAVPLRPSGVTARADRDSRTVLLRVTQALSKAVSFSDLGRVVSEVIVHELDASLAGLSVRGQLVALHGARLPDDPDAHARSFDAHALDFDLRVTQSSEETADSLHWLGAPHVMVLPLAASGLRIGTLVLGVPAAGVVERVGIEAITEVVASAVVRASAYEDAMLDRARAERIADDHDRILARLAHELRNPLAPIVTATQLMALRAPDAVVKERSTIERCAGRLTRLVDELLDATRLARGKLELAREPLELAKVVKTALASVKAIVDEQAHRVEVVVPPLLIVDVDRERLATAIAHLVTNAVKHADPGTPIRIVAARHGDSIALDVIDDGAGISEDKLRGVFEPFQDGRRKGGGLGVGLAIARGIVELHGGTLVAQSDGIGLGARFTIALPRWVARTEEPSPIGTLAPRRILVVDDNQDAAWLLAESLRLLGHEVRMCHDGAQALELAKRWPPEIAFLDIGLPGLDGFALCECLMKELPSRPRCVAVTGYGSARDRERSRAAGFDRHFTKPVDLRDVEDVIASFETMAGAEAP